VFASIASCGVHAQARSHATSWRCLVAGLVPDLLVDAAGEVTEFLVTTYQHGQCLFDLYCPGTILVKSCRSVTTMTPLYSGGARLCAVNGHPTVVKHLLGREVAMSRPSVTNLQSAGLVQHRQNFREIRPEPGMGVIIREHLFASQQKAALLTQRGSTLTRGFWRPGN
jgi:hypothetical protein